MIGGMMEIVDSRDDQSGGADTEPHLRSRLSLAQLSQAQIQIHRRTQTSARPQIRI
jgi:hypothetical protein